MLLGGNPVRPTPDDFSAEVVTVHAKKRAAPGKKKKLLEIAERDRDRNKNKWRRRRIITLLSLNLFFVVSYVFDVQLLEGALTASRLLGFHMADLNSSLQVTLAYRQMLVNLVIGTATVAFIWWLFGGRTFCSWVCPYHLLAEIAESIHKRLHSAKIIRDHALDRRTRTVAWVVFSLLAWGTGFTVFEIISPTGIISRALIYGPTLALLWVLFLLLFEVFYSRRAWCRYLCPIGLMYGVVGVTSPLKVRWSIRECQHELDCQKVCLVPHVLHHIVKGRATRTVVNVGADCTRCGLCVDACPTGSLRFHFTGISADAEVKAEEGERS